MDVRYHTKVASAKELFVFIMKTLRDAALFIEDYRTKSRLGEFDSSTTPYKQLMNRLILGQIVAAQFPKRLEIYAEVLITQKNNFQVAMVMQIAVGVDKIGKRHTFSDLFTLFTIVVVLSESMTSDAFLKMCLDPAKQEPLKDGCLEGTPRQDP